MPVGTLVRRHAKQLQISSQPQIRSHGDRVVGLDGAFQGEFTFDISLITGRNMVYHTCCDGYCMCNDKYMYSVSISGVLYWQGRSVSPHSKLAQHSPTTISRTELREQTADEQSTRPSLNIWRHALWSSRISPDTAAVCPRDPTLANLEAWRQILYRRGNLNGNGCGSFPLSSGCDFSSRLGGKQWRTRKQPTIIVKRFEQGPSP